MPLVETRWVSTAAPVSEQFALWSATVDAAFVPVTVQPAPSEPAEPDKPLEPVVEGGAAACDPRVADAGAASGPGFDGVEGVEGFASSVGVRRFGPVGLAEIVSEPQSVRRQAEHIGRAAGDVYFVNMPLTAGVSAYQDGRGSVLAPGEFVLVDGDRPFELEFTARFTQVSLTVPREEVHARLGDPQSVTGRRVTSSGVGAWAAAAIRTAAQTGGALDAGSARALGDRLLDVLMLAVGGTQLRSAQLGTRVLLQAALDEVDRSLSDSELSPAVVADRLHVSVRQVHNLFAVHGPSFGRWVAARRLDRAHAVLTDPGRRDATVAQVAAECGFGDPAYLARVFKAAYGVSPTAAQLTGRGAETTAPRQRCLDNGA